MEEVEVHTSFCLFAAQNGKNICEHGVTSPPSGPGKEGMMKCWVSEGHSVWLSRKVSERLELVTAREVPMRLYQVVVRLRQLSRDAG